MKRIIDFYLLYLNLWGGLTRINSLPQKVVKPLTWSNLRRHKLTLCTGWNGAPRVNSRSREPGQHPSCRLPFLLTPLTIQPLSFSSGPALDVSTTRNCMSLQVRLGFASRARAHMPAARGADADVPRGHTSTSSLHRSRFDGTVLNCYWYQRILKL